MFTQLLPLSLKGQALPGVHISLPYLRGCCEMSHQLSRVYKAAATATQAVEARGSGRQMMGENSSLPQAGEINQGDIDQALCQELACYRPRH